MKNLADEILTLPDLISRRAAEDGDQIYLEDVDGGSRTYQQLHTQGLCWAHAFRRLGVEFGDRVLIMLPGGFEAVEAWLGLGWLRAIEVPVNTAYRGRMLEYIVENSRAKTILIDSQYVERLSQVATNLTHLQNVVVLGDSTESAPFEAMTVGTFLEGTQPAEDVEAPEPQDIATILYTSGTTGPSKGVLVPWAQVRATAEGSIPVSDLGPDDTFYCPLPLFHIGGKNPLSIMAMAGGRVVMRAGFDTSKFWSDIEEFRCTTTLLLGAMANFLVRQKPRPEDADTTLRNVMMIPLISDLEAFKERFGVRLSTVYNMTEISCPIASNGWDLYNETSCGRVRSGYEVRIVDEFDREVEVGELGELIVRADQPWTMNAGYFDKPEKTVEAWRNQWLHTGDGFTRDAEGNFYFVDRMKDAIRRRGENISSFEVEAEVNEHPDVLESAAVAIPSEWGEDEVKVCVVLKSGSTLEYRSLIEHLASRMPHFMVPRYLEYVDELPKTPTEKIKKVELRGAGVTDTTWDREAHGIEISRG